MAYENFNDDPNFVPMSMPLGQAGLAQAMSYGGGMGGAQWNPVGDNSNAPMVNGAQYSNGYTQAMNYAGGQNQQQDGGFMGGQGGMNGLNANGVPQINGWQKFNSIMQGLGSLANIVGGIKSYNLAKKQFDFQKKSYGADLYNSATDYNGKMTNQYEEADRLSGLDGSRAADRVDRDRMKTTL